MKLIRAAEVPVEERAFGRTVQKVLDLKLCQSFDSMVIYLGRSPQGRLDTHHHSESHEIIFFPQGGFLTVNGSPYEFAAWDGVLLEPGDSHGNESGENHNTIHLAIKVPGHNDKVPTHGVAT
jgi:quercetin dioxygenase-like cupin family protein